MENIPKDVVLYLLDELDLKSILNLCMTSKKYNTMICKNEFFWKLKINRERPGFLSLYEKVRDKYSPPDYIRFIKRFGLETANQLTGFENWKNYKQIYEELAFSPSGQVFSIAWETSPLEIYGVAEGDLQSLNFDPTNVGTEKILKRGDKIWVVVSNRPDLFFEEQILVGSKKEALDIIENEIERIYDGENIARLSSVRETLEENQFIKLGDYEFAFKEVPII